MNSLKRFILITTVSIQTFISCISEIDVCSLYMVGTDLPDPIVVLTPSAGLRPAGYG